MRIKEIRERCEKATKGWILEPCWRGVNNAQTIIRMGSNPSDLCQFRREDDALFTFHAREDIPYLLDLLDRAREIIDKAQDIIYMEFSGTTGDEMKLQHKAEQWLEEAEPE